jgi:hypothetical protein
MLAAAADFSTVLLRRSPAAVVFALFFVLFSCAAVRGVAGLVQRAAAAPAAFCRRWMVASDVFGMMEIQADGGGL